jgi:putative RNA 2'-phosphotransferase
MNRRDRIKLSKLMSVALRHDPVAFDLRLAQDGWVALDALLTGVRSWSRWQWVQTEDILHVVESSDKQRFELDGLLIRARYGHSRAARPNYVAVEPLAVLYHGTPRRNLADIRRHGLKAMSRQYVHLSATPEMALIVGRRRDTTPALLKIRAIEAHRAGIVFGTPSGEEDNVYLVEAVPSGFIEFPE